MTKHSHSVFCTCGASTLNTNAAKSKRVDPTMTGALRKRFENAFIKRFKKLIREIKQQVVTDDGFGLKANNVFEFATDQAKVSGFMSWLQTRVDAVIFDGSLALPRSVAADQSWMNTYVQTAYRRGLQEATSDISKAGGSVAKTFLDTAFLRPVHADRAGIIYSRAYDSLVGITTEMSQQMSDVLAKGLLDGNNPTVIARALADRVEKISITRARLLARTEVIAAHAEAKLNTYEDANIQGVGLLSEMLTAGDDKVCEECEAYSAAGPYEVAAVHGVLPLHPNCRCTWIPVIINGKDIVLT